MNVYQHFATYLNLPIYLEDVKSQIVETGVVGSIKFIRAYHWKPPYEDDSIHAEIHYAASLDEALVRNKSRITV